MNWLEIGCPYCPTVLTVPRTAAGRNVRCPECGKSYIVPEPKHAPSAYEVTTPLPILPASMEEVEFEEFAAAAVAKPAADAPATLPEAAPPSPSYPAAPQREPLSPPPAPPAPKHPAPRGNSAPVATVPVTPSADAPPPPSSPAGAPPISSPPAPPLDNSAAEPVAPRVRRRMASNDLMYPDLEKDSPLPEIEILPPPGQHPSVKKSPTSQPANAPAAANDSAPSPSNDLCDTRTYAADPPPYGSAPYGASLPRSAAEEAAAMEEVQQRIRRHRMKALINLAAFVVGILVMTAFAFIVVRLTRPS